MTHPSNMVDNDPDIQVGTWVIDGSGRIWNKIYTRPSSDHSFSTVWWDNDDLISEYSLADIVTQTGSAHIIPEYPVIGINVSNEKWLEALPIGSIIQLHDYGGVSQKTPFGWSWGIYHMEPAELLATTKNKLPFFLSYIPEKEA